MSFAEYARYRGVSSAAVTRAVKGGRISPIEVDGKPMLDADVADAQWARNTRGRIKSSAQKPNADALSSPLAAEIHDIQKARAKREFHEANLAEMRELKESGTLLDRESVEKAVVEASSTLRLALEQVPSKLGLRLAAESDPDVCRALISELVDQALAEAHQALTAVADK